MLSEGKSIGSGLELVAVVALTCRNKCVTRAQLKFRVVAQFYSGNYNITVAGVCNEDVQSRLPIQIHEKQVAKIDVGHGQAAFIGPVDLVACKGATLNSIKPAAFTPWVHPVLRARNAAYTGLINAYINWAEGGVVLAVFRIAGAYGRGIGVIGRFVGLDGSAGALAALVVAVGQHIAVAFAANTADGLSGACSLSTHSVPCFGCVSFAAEGAYSGLGASGNSARVLMGKFFSLCQSGGGHHAHQHQKAEQKTYELFSPVDGFHSDFLLTGDLKRP